MTTDDVYYQVSELKSELQSLTEKMDTVIGVLGQQAGIIRGFEDERQREIGAKSMIKFIWAMLTAGVAAMAYVLHDLVIYFFPPKLH